MLFASATMRLRPTFGLPSPTAIESFTAMVLIEWASASWSAMVLLSPAAKFFGAQWPQAAPPPLTTVLGVYFPVSNAVR